MFKRAARLRRELDDAYKTQLNYVSELADVNSMLTITTRARRTAERSRDALQAEVAELRDQLAAQSDVKKISGSQEKMLLWLLENAPQEILGDPAAPRDACELALVTLETWKPRYGKPAQLVDHVDMIPNDEDELAHRTRRRR